METELAFNEAVTTALEEVQSVVDQLKTGRDALENGQILSAIKTLEQLESGLANRRSVMNTNVTSILAENVAAFRTDLVQQVQARWREQVHVDKAGECSVTRDKGMSAQNRNRLFYAR